MTNHFTSATEGGQIWSAPRDYASMTDWELEQIGDFRWRGLALLPSAYYDEVNSRYHARMLADEWSRLKREGFGM